MSYRISWTSLVAAAVLAVSSPLVASGMSAATPGWDDLPHRVVLLWVVSIGAALVAGIGLLIAVLVAPYWDAGWL